MPSRGPVVVIGGGLAGIAAARELVRAGVETTLLEARSRLGGRVHTLRDEAAPGAGAVELGAELIEDAHGPVARAVRDGGGALYDAAGDVWLLRDGALELVPDLVGSIGAILGRLHDATDRSLRDALEERCAGARWASARALLEHHAAGYHAADPERVSVRWLEAVQEGGDDESGALGFDHAPGGLDRAVSSLAAEVVAAGAVRLGAEVTHVRWRRGHVVVAVRDQGIVEARAAIVTLPLAVLKRDAVAFDPPLAAKAHALASLEAGDVVKLALRFDSPPWDDVEVPGHAGDLARAKFFFAPGAAFPTFWTPAPVRSPVLMAWAGGAAARRLASLPLEARVDVALTTLARVLDREPRALRARLVTAHGHDWSADPLSRAAYSWVPAGATDAPIELARPLHDTLFFAGEATACCDQAATMDGAFGSGFRAARALLGTGRRAMSSRSSSGRLRAARG